MAGSIINPKRPRYQANERFDTVDADAQSRAPRDTSKAVTRSLSSAPRNTAGNPSLVGMIVTGFELTLNPINGTDGKVRVGSNVGVALDADGGLVIKPQGTTFDITIPTGTFQLYAYYVEVETDNAKRRFLSVTSPFVESTIAINTSFQGSCSFVAISGNAASVVPEAVVNGVTTPLCCIGIVTNGGSGAITCAGYDATNAPNGTDIAGRLSVPELTSSPPASPFVNGSIRSVTEMVKHLTYTIGQLAWKGSNQTPPTFSNNRGAYSLPQAGIDPTYRNLSGYVTIGNGTTVFGDFDTSGFANSKLLLDAVYATLPTTGGSIVIKRGVQLTGWGGITSTTPASKRITFIGDHREISGSTPQLVFGSGESITVGAGGSVTFSSIHIQWTDNAVLLTTTPTTFIDCHFTKGTTTDTGAALSGTTVSDLVMERCTASLGLSAGTANGMLFRTSGATRRVNVKQLLVSITNKECSVFGFADMRDDVSFADVSISDTGSTGTTSGVALIVANSTDNATESEVRGRRFRNLVGSTVNIPLMLLGTAGHLAIEGVYFSCTGGVAIKSTAYAGSGRVLIRGGRVPTMSLVGVWPDLRVEHVVFTSTTSGSDLVIGDVTGTHGKITVRGCQFACINSCTVNVLASQLVWIDRCEWNGLQDATTPDWACARVITGTGFSAKNDLVRFTGNVVRDFQNVANYTGSGSINHRIFEFDGRATLIECMDNSATKIMDGTSGAGSTRLGAYLLDVSSNDRSTDISSISTIRVDRNTISGDGVGLIVMRHNSVSAYKITNNNVFTSFMGTTNDVTLKEVIQLAPGSGTGSLNTLVITENHINVNMLDNVGLTLNVDIIKYVQTGTAGLLNDVVVQANQFNFTGSSANTTAFDFTNGWGVQFPSDAIANLVFKHNVTHRGTNTADASTWFQTRFTGTVSQSIPAVATASAAWSDNIGIKGVIV